MNPDASDCEDRMNVLSSVTSRMHRLLRAFPLLTGLGLILVLAAASCGKMPLLAPTGTVINLTITSETAALNSSVDIIAVLIENGQQSSGTGTGTAATGTSVTGAGTPVQDGTVVSFTTSIGTIEPAEGKTVNGRVSVKLKTNGESGKATITAYSGGAKSTASISIGAANAKTVSVTASPQNLPATGGSSTISAFVQDASGNGIAGVPVLFSTTKGTLSATSVNSDASGIATTKLTTTSAADVTATAGSVAGVKVSVGVSARASISITGPTGGTISQSTPAAFTLDAGAASTAVPLTNITIDYGDGSTPSSLGSFSGTRGLIHFYSEPGIRDVRVSALDPDGVAVSSAMQIAVTSLSGTFTGTPTTTVARDVSTSLGVTVTANALIDSYVWDFGDGTDAVRTTGNTQTHIYASTLPGLPKTYTITVTVYPKYGTGNYTYFTLTLQIRVT